MRKKPLVSILMPAYNAGSFLHDAVRSIISQKYKNWELICVDDNSSDNTYSLLKFYSSKDSRIKVLRNEKNEGISFSLNRALCYARGEFIARMDADDISLPDRIRKQVSMLLRRGNLVACGGQVAIINFKNDIVAYKKFPLKNKELYKMIMSYMPIQHPAIMVRRGIYKNYKYDTRISTAEDVDFLFYLLHKGDIGNLDSIVYYYRKHERACSIKKAFYLTLLARIKSIFKYKYKPSFSGILNSFLQLVAVTILPEKLGVNVFEFLRLDPKQEPREEESDTLENHNYIKTNYWKKPSISPSI